MQARGRAQFGKRRSRVKKLGNWKGIAIGNTLRGKDPEGDNQGLGEPVRTEGKMLERKKRWTRIWGKSLGAIRGVGGWLL